jgi:hypothetical protein
MMPEVIPWFRVWFARIQVLRHTFCGGTRSAVAIEPKMAAWNFEYIPANAFG